MRALVWRYVSAMHRKMDDEEVTEDDINELKGDVSALRYELLEVFEKNGMDVSFTDRKEQGEFGFSGWKVIICSASRHLHHICQI